MIYFFVWKGGIYTAQQSCLAVARPGGRALPMYGCQTASTVTGQVEIPGSRCCMKTHGAPRYPLTCRFRERNLWAYLQGGKDVFVIYALGPARSRAVDAQRGFHARGAERPGPRRRSS